MLKFTRCVLDRKISSSYLENNIKCSNILPIIIYPNIKYNIITRSYISSKVNYLYYDKYNYSQYKNNSINFYKLRGNKRYYSNTNKIKFDLSIIKYYNNILKNENIYFKNSSRSYASKKNKQDNEDVGIIKYMEKDFSEINEKNKETFLEVIDTFKEITKQRVGQVEFINSALKYMKEFGVHNDLEMYKALINVLPKGKLVAENFLQSEFMHYPKQQNCIIELLEQMEDNGVIPDWETQDILVNIFGERAYPLRRYYRMMYWMPKFRHASPWLLPNPIPTDSFELAKLAIARIMSVDPRHSVDIYESKDIEDSIDHTWIVSGISEAQRKLIADQPKEKPIYVEGGFRIWLRDQSIIYYILRTDPGSYEEYVREDPDDIRNMIDPFSIPDLFELKKKVRTIHEQDDGIILSVAATGTSSHDSLLSWVRSLEKDGNPRLGEVPIMFTMNSPLGKTEGNEEISGGENSIDQGLDKLHIRLDKEKEKVDREKLEEKLNKERKNIR